MPRSVPKTRSDLPLAGLLALGCLAAACTGSAPQPRVEQARATPDPSSDGGGEETRVAERVEPAPAPSVAPPPKPEEPPKPVKVTAPRIVWTKAAAPGGAWREAPEGSVLAEAKAVGKPIMLVQTDAGLRLQAWDSEWSRALDTGWVRSALYDPRSGVLLFTGKDHLYAMDLAEPLAVAADPVIVDLPSTPGPTKVVLGDHVETKDHVWLDLALVYEGYKVVTYYDPGAHYLRLSWENRPTSSQIAPFYPPDDDYEPIRRKLDGAWLSARKARRKWAEPLPSNQQLQFPSEREPSKVADLMLVDRCWDYLCGAALPLGISGFELVIVGEFQGDVHHVNTLVRRPARSGKPERWISYAGFIAWLAAGAQPFDLSETTASPAAPEPGNASSSAGGAEVPEPKSEAEPGGAGPADADAGSDAPSATPEAASPEPVVRLIGPGLRGGSDEPVDEIEWLTREQVKERLDELASEQIPRFDVSGEVFVRRRGHVQVCSMAGKCAVYEHAVLEFLAGNVDVGVDYADRP